MAQPNGVSSGRNSGVDTNYASSIASDSSTQSNTQTRRQSPSQSRVQRSIEREDSGFNAASLVGAILKSALSPLPSFYNFTKVLEKAFGSSPGHSGSIVDQLERHIKRSLGAAFDPHSGDDDTSQSTAHPPSANASRPTSRRGILGSWETFGDGAAKAQQMEAYRQQKQAWLDGGSVGPEPEVPDCIPSELRAAVAKLDPSEDTFGHAMLKMVNENTQLQKSATGFDPIGQAPQPRPGRFHHDHHGNDVVPDMQNTTDPETGEVHQQVAPDDLYQGNSAPASPALGNARPLQPRQYQQPRVSNPEDEPASPTAPPRLPL